MIAYFLNDKFGPYTVSPKFRILLWVHILMSITKYHLPSVLRHAVFDSWCTLTLTFDSPPKQFRLLQITNSCMTELYCLHSYFYMQQVLYSPKTQSQTVYEYLLMFTFQEDLVVPETMHGCSKYSCSFLSVYPHKISDEFVVTFRIMHGCIKGHDFASFLIFWVYPCVLHIPAYFHVLHWQLKCAETQGVTQNNMHASSQL